MLQKLVVCNAATIGSIRANLRANGRKRACHEISDIVRILAIVVAFRKKQLVEKAVAPVWNVLTWAAVVAVREVHAAAVVDGASHGGSLLPHCLREVQYDRLTHRHASLMPVGTKVPNFIVVHARERGGCGACACLSHVLSIIPA